jgi:integrase
LTTTCPHQAREAHDDRRPREAISDFVFPSRTDPAAGARNFWAEEIKELAEKADIADFKPHDLRRWAMRGSE